MKKISIIIVLLMTSSATINASNTMPAKYQNAPAKLWPLVERNKTANLIIDTMQETKLTMEQQIITYNQKPSAENYIKCLRSHVTYNTLMLDFNKIELAEAQKIGAPQFISDTQAFMETMHQEIRKLLEIQDKLIFNQNLTKILTKNPS